MNKSAYRQYLESGEWQERRQAAMIRADGYCERCGKEAVHVHHLSYDNLGCEDDDDLIALCEECHRLEHEEGGGNHTFYNPKKHSRYI